MREALDDEHPQVELREASLAALLAWLFPGAGHFYQRRYLKATIFSITILSTYIAGLIIGDGQVVYASWRPNDYRWQFACQAGIGLPAAPAVMQYLSVKDGKEPFFPNRAFLITQKGIVIEEVPVGTPGSRSTAYFTPAPGPVSAFDRDVLAIWHEESEHRFEIGTLYTVVAGLLNLLVVYDAFAGPFVIADEKDKKSKKEE